MRWFVRAIALFVVVALLGTGFVIYLLIRAQPIYEGMVKMPELSAVVSVYRDAQGVPHIFAANMFDAARALGYIHADERLFQMEMQRRAGQGRLAEILGPDMLKIDKFTRTLGLYRLAQDSYRTLSPDAQKLLDAYTEGVNFWLNSHRHSLPPQFFLLHFSPEPWAPADSLVWSKLMALQLSGNYEHEIARAQLAKKFSPDEINALIPPPPAGAPVTTMPQLDDATKARDPFISSNNDLQECEADFVMTHASGLSKLFSSFHLSQTKGDTILAAGDMLGRITGLDHAASNEWVIAGSLTKNGRPILANDPHLGLDLPILWYLARIETPDVKLTGATVPGLPVVLLGHNDHIAWGFTTTGSDVQDLFIETVDSQNPNRYLAPDGLKDFETRDELIRIKDAPDVILKVRATRHGPVLSDINPELAQLAGKGKVLALAFTALDQDDATPEALMGIDRAKNWPEFMDALKLYRAPPQNIVYADTDGNIGFVAAGVVPVRKRGDGQMPVNGATGESDWTGTIPFEQWPRVYNPPVGFVFNANNAVVGTDKAHEYGNDWEEPYRALRLQEFFDYGDQHSMETSALMQADHVSLVARALLPYLAQLKPDDPDATAALDALRGWNGVMNCDKPQPLIFDAWLYEMHKALADKAGDQLAPEGPFDALAIENALAGKPGPLCGKDQGCKALAAQAFTEAITLLKSRDGDDIKNWRWGKEHYTLLRDKFFSRLPLMAGASDLHIPASGDFYTLDRGGSAAMPPEHPFTRTHGGGFRGIYDLGDLDQSRFMIATGESGDPFSKHYSNLALPWNEIKSFTLSGSQTELEQRGLPKLVFAPKN